MSLHLKICIYRNKEGGFNDDNPDLVTNVPQDIESYLIYMDIQTNFRNIPKIMDDLHNQYLTNVSAEKLRDNY